LNLLRDMLGPEAMQRAVAHYVQLHAAGIVVTDDLRRALEESSGQDLRGFFDEFLLGAGVPEFRVRLAEGERALTVEQVQGGHGGRAVFHLPVWVTWSRGGSERSARLDVHGASETLPLDGEGPLDWCRFDSHTAVPGRIDQEQSEAQWRQQLAAASDGVSRLLAARWFLGTQSVRAEVPPGWSPAPESAAALVAAAGRDPLPEVRVAALAALALRGASDDEAVAQALLAAARAPDPRVREAAAQGLARHGEAAALAALRTLVDDDNASVTAAALGALVDLDYPGAFGLCTAVAARSVHRSLAGSTDLDAAIVRLVTRIEDDEEVLPFVLAAARWQPVPGVRVAAMDALASLADLDGVPGAGDPDGVIFRQLGESLGDGDHRVRAAAARELRQIAEALPPPPAADPGDGALLAADVRQTIAARARAALALLSARRTIELDHDVLTAIDESAGP
ncbi:MAG TPA: HEAT repeat domain-containing protein, partial [Planctomycetota bacterium]|nr:HEAT repeat domain-containing protein [Planctomycetota bacterium]